MHPGRLVSTHTISGAEFLTAIASLSNYSERDFLQNASIFVRLADLKPLVAVRYPIRAGAETKTDIFENNTISNCTFGVDQLESMFNRIAGIDMMYALKIFDLFSQKGAKIDLLEYLIDIVRFEKYISVIFRHKNSPPGGRGGEGFWASISYQDGSVIRSAFSR